jgi:hypothetical protein
MLSSIIRVNAYKDCEHSRNEEIPKKISNVIELKDHRSMTTNSPVPLSWLEKRRQRRRKTVFTRSVITIIILVLLAILLATIGLLYTVQGGVILAVVAIIAELVP